MYVLYRIFFNQNVFEINMHIQFIFIFICISFSYFQVPSNNNEDTTKTPVSGVVANWQSADLGGKVQELHDTLGRLRQEAEDSIERVRQESEDKIERLKRESDDATKTIAKLQMQLEQQSDYDLLKREVQ